MTPVIRDSAKIEPGIHKDIWMCFLHKEAYHSGHPDKRSTDIWEMKPMFCFVFI